MYTWHKLTRAVQTHIKSPFMSPFTDKSFVSWEILSVSPEMLWLVSIMMKPQTKQTLQHPHTHIHTLVHTSTLSISSELCSRVTPFKTFSETEWRPPRLFSSKRAVERHRVTHLQLRRVTGPASWLTFVAPTLCVDPVLLKSPFSSQNIWNRFFFPVLMH